MEKEKVVPLRPRTEAHSDFRPWNRIVGFVQPEMSEMEICLQEAAAQAPAMIRDALFDRALHGERFCPALFLAVAKHRNGKPLSLSRLAASLEALALALQVHRSIEPKNEFSPPTRQLLVGDFFFSLALTLAAEAPIFIKGMAEIITRVVASELKQPRRQGCLQHWRKSHLQGLSDGSASVMALSATLGAWHGRYEPWQNEALAYFGHYVGLALRLNREQEIYKRGLANQNVFVRISLPLIYVMEQSPRQSELLAMLRQPSHSEEDYQILLQEDQRINPKSYMDVITANCIVRAREHLDALRPELDPASADTLSSFLQYRQLV